MRIRLLHILSVGIAILSLALQPAKADASARQTLDFDRGWKFAFGDASSKLADFGYATEYFTYWTKAASIHNEGPYSPKFDASSWEDVSLPHDWVVDLPFDSKASHSHGYKTVGPTYPKTSVGWYRKEFEIPQSDWGRCISIRFDGIFHSSQVWVNGFYLGREDDGYVSSEYDITQYLNYGGSNVITVRVDASQESGWFYEGAGIYRHAWLIKKGGVNIVPDGVYVHSGYDNYEERTGPHFIVETRVTDNTAEGGKLPVLDVYVLDREGRQVGANTFKFSLLSAQMTLYSSLSVDLGDVHLWDVDDPYLYTVLVKLSVDGEPMDELRIRTGFRTVEFDPQQGVLLNGKRVQIKGVNLHQDHAGVGSAITDDLYAYRLERLRSFGCNAIRSSHNPMAPALLDLCDSLGFLVMDENRLMGVNAYHREHMERMIKRDRNHPSVIIWSIGNEEWALEWNDLGRRITSIMREICHRLDPFRPMTVATSSGPDIEEPADVFGFNYIMQNDVDGMKEKYPERTALGTEETTGCGTRGCYFDDASGAWMPALNRSRQGADSLYNCIERGWKFYHQRPWLGGLFYWTGFDYRGESNPLVFPATGSSFGILDYCGFYKDEAWYLKSWWTDEPVLHILPHWNLAGHEGEEISVWAYSNCDAVELFVNGRSMGRKTMPADGHLEWEAVYRPGSIKAVGYRSGRQVAVQTVRTSGMPQKIRADKFLRPSTAVIDLKLYDKKSNFVPDANNILDIEVEGPAYIMGVGNGDSGWQQSERPADALARRNGSAARHSFPAFNGCAQVILGSSSASIGRDEVKLRVRAEGCETLEIVL